MSLVNSCVVDMDVDGPVSGSGTLKRCSSAPMINETNSIMTTTTTPSGSTNRDQQNFNIFGTAAQTRTRRFSASFSPVPGSPVSGLRLTPRINQLRQEDFADISNQRELAHEREIHHTMQISQSWEDLSLMNESQNDTKSNNNNNNNNNNKMGPLHVNLPTYGNFMCNSPSPTRLTSPGFQSPTRTSRTFIRRSASPVLRPSPLGVKRKLDDDCNKTNDYHMSPRAKRFHSYSSSTTGGLLTTTITTTTTTSISLPGSLSSVGTPESLSSADSPSGFNFRNVDSPSPNHRTMTSEPMILSKNDHDMNESPS